MKWLIAAVMCLPLAAIAAEPGVIRVYKEKSVVILHPDGAEPQRSEEHSIPLGWEFSPDGKHAAYVGGDEAVYIADADGKNPRRITPDKLACGSPRWSPESQRLAIAARRGEFYQVHTVNRDGTDLVQITFVPEGAWMQKFGPDGRLSYVTWPPPRQKLQPANLVIRDGKETRPVVTGVYLSEYAWSPDGKTIAYSTIGRLVFHDLASGKEQAVAFRDIDPRLDSHSAWHLCFSPDSRRVACTIRFLGGRLEGTRIFGDTQVFVVDPSGKTRSFQPGEDVRRLEWVK